jgi:hypothetical protein
MLWKGQDMWYTPLSAELKRLPNLDKIAIHRAWIKGEIIPNSYDEVRAYLANGSRVESIIWGNLHSLAPRYSN